MLDFLLEVKILVLVPKAFHMIYNFLLVKFCYHIMVYYSIISIFPFTLLFVPLPYIKL